MNDDQSKLHNHNGSVLQLLSIAVHPDYSHLQVGQALRDFVKRICADKFSGMGSVWIVYHSRNLTNILIL